MSLHLDRRQLLRLSVGAAATTGLLAAGALPAAAAGPSCPPLPNVPGMLGDVRNNEFWYQFDEVLYFDVPDEIGAAYQAINANFSDLEEGIAFYWLAERTTGDYPNAYAARWAPVRSSLKVLMDAQLKIMDRYYRHDDRGLEQAFVDFAQGVLFDPRRGDSSVHTMDGTPPAGYHIWHAYMRAAVLLGISPARWKQIDRFNGLAWHLQSIAKPSRTTVNAPLDRQVVQSVRRLWSQRGAEAVDEAFESVPYPAGVS
jgi:hypothetical protein